MHSIAGWGLWLGFTLFLMLALTMDAYFGRRYRQRDSQSMRDAFVWTGFWVGCALLFNLVLWAYLHETSTAFVANTKAVEFLTGYLIEKTLSIDNLFVFYLVFHHFRLPSHLQRRVFTYGIWGAIIMRLGLICIGVWLVTKFHWLIYAMGFFLFLTALKMMFVSEKEKDLSETLMIRLVKKCFRLTPQLHGEHFFIRENGKLTATPMFLALIMIEFSDLVFAFDSIPAIFAITRDPFIVWSSNIFAILGLRSLYFVLAGMIERFHLLKYGIALILAFVGIKMMIEPWLEIGSLVSLLVITLIIILFTSLSVLKAENKGV